MTKYIFLMTFIASIAHAGNLTLGSGESATIYANTHTTVTCNADGSSGPSCHEAVSGLKTLVEACISEYTKSSCINKYWPTFKKDNPTCAFSSIKLCIDYCSSEYTRASCADKCK